MENIFTFRFLSNINISVSNLILICSLVQPAMDIKKSMEKLLLFLTLKTQNSTEFEEANKSLIMFNDLHKQLSIYGSLSINNRFLYLVLTSCFSFLIVLLQFEIESSKVNHFNVFEI